jgi:hypothetical protein
MNPPCLGCLQDIEDEVTESCTVSNLLEERQAEVLRFLQAKGVTKLGEFEEEVSWAGWKLLPVPVRWLPVAACCLPACLPAVCSGAICHRVATPHAAKQACNLNTPKSLPHPTAHNRRMASCSPPLTTPSCLPSALTIASWTSRQSGAGGRKHRWL